jgi:thioester reductase-like protein
MFSISEQFSSAVVLLTGATGYVGGLVLESLLRATNVAKVYVLLRDKAGSSAKDRLSQLLQVSCTAGLWNAQISSSTDTFTMMRLV